MPPLAPVPLCPPAARAEPAGTRHFACLPWREGSTRVGGRGARQHRESSTSPPQLRPLLSSASSPARRTRQHPGGGSAGEKRGAAEGSLLPATASRDAAEIKERHGTHAWSRDWTTSNIYSDSGRLKALVFMQWSHKSQRSSPWVA